MKVYAVVERDLCHGVFESEAIASLLANEIAAEVFKMELNQMSSDHLVRVEERLKNGIEQLSQQVDRMKATLSSLRGGI